MLYYLVQYTNVVFCQNHEPQIAFSRFQTDLLGRRARLNVVAFGWTMLQSVIFGAASSKAEVRGCVCLNVP